MAENYDAKTDKAAEDANSEIKAVRIKGSATRSSKTSRTVCKVAGCHVVLDARNVVGYCGKHWLSVGQHQARLTKQKSKEANLAANGSNGHAIVIPAKATKAGAPEHHNGNGRTLIEGENYGQEIAEQRVNNLLLGLPLFEKLQLVDAYLQGKV